MRSGQAYFAGQTRGVGLESDNAPLVCHYPVKLMDLHRVKLVVGVNLTGLCVQC